ncbi:unnamed protein product [Phytophthora fragariaefolia]|uniref:Unnamed protein product n=1 Tax=Phytophthora fragariaefolia TaxID=1490495 RepID=A0A9W6Y5K7_9STRA|nr:unnamed protein product [Phytophthora fragariaefolia]
MSIVFSLCVREVVGLVAALIYVHLPSQHIALSATSDMPQAHSEAYNYYVVRVPSIKVSHRDSTLELSFVTLLGKPDNISRAHSAIDQASPNTQQETYPTMKISHVIALAAAIVASAAVPTNAEWSVMTQGQSNGINEISRRRLGGGSLRGSTEQQEQQLQGSSDEDNFSRSEVSSASKSDESDQSDEDAEDDVSSKSTDDSDKEDKEVAKKSKKESEGPDQEEKGGEDKKKNAEEKKDDEEDQEEDKKKDKGGKSKEEKDDKEDKGDKEDKEDKEEKEDKGDKEDKG